MKPLRFMAFVAAATAPLVVAMPGAATASDRTASISSAAHQYLVDSAPVATVSAIFQSAVLSWMGSTNVAGPEAEAAARPLISALVTFQDKLGSQTWLPWREGRCSCARLRLQRANWRPAGALPRRHCGYLIVGGAVPERGHHHYRSHEQASPRPRPAAA